MTNADSGRLTVAPLNLLDRFLIARHAVAFFNPRRYEKSCEASGAEFDPTTIRPLSLGDFLRYLSKVEPALDAYKLVFQIRGFLAQLASGGVLDEVGASNPLVAQHYYFLRHLTQLERRGWTWLSSALGPEFLYNVFAQVTVQLTGMTAKGDAHAGTGIVIGPSLILTCAHVLTDMQLDDEQELQGKRYRVVHAEPHRHIDVALVEVDGQLECLDDLAFTEPVLGEEVYVLGYPRIHYTREAALLLHRGEITNTSVTTFEGHRLFLYSAIARPGNSGGPIISRSGRIVGLVTKELFEKPRRAAPTRESARLPEVAPSDGADAPSDEDESLPSIAPFYAGVPTLEVVKALSGLSDSVKLPVEDFT